MKQTILLITFTLLFRLMMAQGGFGNPADSVVGIYVNKVNADSIWSYMQSLENFGTRFCLAPNRRQVAEWIMNKFLSFGYGDVVLDSFPYNRTWNGTYYQTWQYNVVCTYPGYLQPDQIYILGAHYDAIVQSGNPLLIAPGADDNASGVAAALETARVMKHYGYQPRSTIRFIAFAAEELGLHGSSYYAQKAAQQNMQIQVMINNDMISYDVAGPSGWKIRLQHYNNSQWVTSLATYIAQQFTTLGVTTSTQYIQYSDSWPFYQQGYAAIFLQENTFTAWYHTINDLVSTTSKEYTAEMVKVSLGMLVHQNGPGIPTGITNPGQQPAAVLEHNFPNPFRQQTVLRFTIIRESHVTLKIYDPWLREVAVLYDGFAFPGTERIVFERRQLPAGLYIAVLQSGNEKQTLKLTITD